MIYAAFAVWLFLILFAGVGVYRLWTRLVSPAWVNWVLLPGTIVSEMAYIFGCLITGGEIRRAKLLSVPGKAGRDDGEARTDVAPGIKVLGPLVAGLLPLLSGIGTMLLARELLGDRTIEAFAVHTLPAGGLPKALPTSWASFWNHLGRQIALLRQMCETLAGHDWLDWRGVLFVYLAACLSVRLSPVTRPMRPTLAAAVVISGGIALAGLVWDGMTGLLEGEIWWLMTFVWSLLLTLLSGTLILRGLVALARILAGRRRA